MSSVKYSNCEPPKGNEVQMNNNFEEASLEEEDEDHLTVVNNLSRATLTLSNVSSWGHAKETVETEPSSTAVVNTKLEALPNSTSCDSGTGHLIEQLKRANLPY
jgi:hypothetical protein